MTALALDKRLEIWEAGLNRLALMIEQRGVEGEKLLPLYERIERELASDQRKGKTLNSVQQRIKRLKGEMATQSLQADHAAT